jgi:pimeloyl-ACP methyl ester carboxylesterase
VTGLLIILALGLLLAWLGAVLAVHRVLTRPPRRTYASAVARSRPGDPGEMAPPRRFESWTLDTRGLALPVWDIAGDNPAGPIVVASHGWGDSRIGVLQRLPLLAPSARRIIAWDMPGHGDAPGRSSLGTHEVADLTALVERAAASEPEADRRVVLYGWSLGAEVSIAAAAAVSGEHGARAAIRGVIAEAPYRVPVTPAASMIRVMRWPALGALRTALWLASLGAPGLRRPGAFDRAAHAAKLSCPLLVLHGEADEICPVRDGRAIGAAGTVVAFPGAGHNDLWQSENRLAEGEAAIGAFVSRLGRSPD